MTPEVVRKWGVALTALLPHPFALRVLSVEPAWRRHLRTRIIRERRRQANFQLIVITHDEGFLQRLAAHDVLEYYW